MTKEPTHIQYLKSLGACNDALTFASHYSTLQEAWDACNVPEWLFWLLTKQALGIENDSRKAVVFAAAQCARTALKYTKDPRVLKCIQTTEAYVCGEATLADVRAAATAAHAATTAAHAAAHTANAASYAAANAAHAATTAATAANAAHAAHAAAHTANAASYAAAVANAAANAATTLSSNLECCNIIKKLFPKIRMGKWVVNPNYKGGQHD